MTKYGKHPWPTDGITRKQLDRELDKLTRRIDHWKERTLALQAELEAIKQWRINVVEVAKPLPKQ